MWDAVQKHLLRAREEAVGLGHPFVGTEHLLLALIAEEPELFRQVGGDVEGLRAAVLAQAEQGGEPVPDDKQLPFSERGRKVLEVAAAQSMQGFDDQVRPEYLLVALAEIGEGIAGRALREAGLPADALRVDFRLEPLDPDLRKRVTAGATIWEREPLTKLIGNAHHEARRHAHGYVGTEHILLAVLDDAQGPGPAMLDALGADLGLIREAVEERMAPAGNSAGEGQLPFTAAAKQVLIRSRAEAEGRGEQSISSAHLLLGILAEPTGVAGSVLRDEFGIDAERLRGMI